MVQLKNIALALGVIAPVIGLPSASAFSDGRYIVTLKDGVANVSSHVASVNSRGLARRGVHGVNKVWSKYFKGYSGDFDVTTLDELARDEDVLDIEPVQTWHLYAVETQQDAPWGLASLSAGGKPGAADYLYDSSAGEGTFAYVVDSGVLLTHADFGGRASSGYNAYPGVEDEDTVGHGTHVAGTIAGTTYGVAKRAEIISVKVFGDADSTTDIILDGFEWAVEDIASKGTEAVSVINMSLGGGFSAAFNRAVDAATAQGVLSVVAAGNEFVDARNVSPASAASALTVGAVDARNAKPGFSNFGAAVDIFAPGVAIESAWNTGASATNTIDGTSMAAPHVAGLALYLTALEGLAGGESTKDFLLGLGVEGVLSTVGAGSPNLLAFNGVNSRNSTTRAR